MKQALTPDQLSQVVVELRELAVKKWRMAGYWNDAEDFAQEVALKCLERAKQYRGENGASLKTYLRPAITTVPLDCLRKEWNRKKYAKRLAREEGKQEVWCPKSLAQAKLKRSDLRDSENW